MTQVAAARMGHPAPAEIICKVLKINIGGGGINFVVNTGQAQDLRLGGGVSPSCSVPIVRRRRDMFGKPLRWGRGVWQAQGGITVMVSEIPRNETWGARRHLP